MSQAIAIIKLVAALIPAIIALMKAIEEALPQAGIGAEKLSIIRAAFEGLYNAAADSLPDIEKTWAVVQTVINALVALFNKTGTFNK